MTLLYIYLVFPIIGQKLQVVYKNNPGILKICIDNWENLC